MNVQRPTFSAGHTATELERRASDLRADIDMTLDEISARLAPAHLRDVATAKVRRSGIGLTLRAIRTIQHRPKIVATAGIVALALIHYWRNGQRS